VMDTSQWNPGRAISESPIIRPKRGGLQFNESGVPVNFDAGQPNLPAARLSGSEIGS